MWRSSCPHTARVVSSCGRWEVSPIGCCRRALFPSYLCAHLMQPSRYPWALTRSRRQGPKSPHGQDMRVCGRVNVRSARIVYPFLRPRRGSAEIAARSCQVVRMKLGQTLEIRLAASLRWRLAQGEWSAIMSAPPENGWWDTVLQVCVWQFTATKAGAGTLTCAGP